VINYSNEKIEQSSVKNKSTNGCLVIISIIFAPYILNAIYLLGGSFINQAIWQSRGSSSYKATVSMTAFSPLMGSSTITVKDGKVIAAKRSSSETDYNLKVFDEITIERMFADIKDCSIFFPLLWCSFEYDPYYGYPKRVTIDCPIADACLTHLWVDKLELIKP
jgi:hypothetical protein